MSKKNNNAGLTLTFIGTGAVYATPVLGCDCMSCQRALNDPKYERLPASVLLQTLFKSTFKTTSSRRHATRNLEDTGDDATDFQDTDTTTLLIDAGHPRLEHVVRRHGIRHILLTHYHPDHVQGLFALRWGMPNYTIDVIAPDDPVGCADLFKHSGILNFDQKTSAFKPFVLSDITITPLPMRHSKLTHGYLIEHSSVTCAYLTDTLGLDAAVIDFINQKSAELCIIDCTYAPTEQPKNHNNLTIVQDLQNQLNNIPMWLTHIGHGMDTWYMEHHGGCSERGIYMARDDMSLTF